MNFNTNGNLLYKQNVIVSLRQGIKNTSKITTFSKVNLTIPNMDSNFSII
ncbi:hypothetical protein EMUCRT_0790 [Ehrlichia cf. muris str. EmCRT]|uniref:Uncharacterized protein n=1 Tax=Ehrlichia cf. muris str. EmCRT TaxID=1359167 RepID=A0A0F3N5G8_9RICK|nr:hypothetical protein EMUCRT_0790 [Ehrlichia cf. muris str. EmCRT]